MGQLTSITRRPPAVHTLVGDPGGRELEWLRLLDRLYALVEADGFGPGHWTQGESPGWPGHWQPLLRSWAERIGAKSLQIVEPRRAPPAQRHTARLSSRLGITAHPPGQGPVVQAQSLCADGFSADQEREFRAVCSHLHTALALQAKLSAAQQSLAGLYGVLDALPVNIVMLDEQLNVVRINRLARDWLAHTEKATVEQGRLSLSAQRSVFDSALHELASDPFELQRGLHVNGLTIQLKKLAHATAAPTDDEAPPFNLLLQIHEDCDRLRSHQIVVPPAELSWHLQHLFALTDRELALAWNLAQGMPLKQYAGLSGRSTETARAQLKSVFRKLGVSGQSGIGMVLFDTLHALTLQSWGAQLAATTAGRTAVQPPAWR